MKKIVFAGDWVMEKVVGVQRYAYQILLALDRLLEQKNSVMQMELLIPQNSEWVCPFKQIKVIKKGHIESKLDKHLWQQFVFPGYVTKAKAIGVDLALALPVWGCKVCAIHDCILEAYPEGFTDHRLFRYVYLFKVKKTARIKNRHIITVSQNAKREIQKYYSIPDERISVIGNGWNHMAAVQQDDSVFDRLPAVKKNEYFFSLGSKYKHKNFEWVLKTAVLNPQYQFVVSGEDVYTNNADLLRRHHIQNVMYTGYLTDGELKSLMQHCRAMIQPSLYEGFGIPPLEALSLGKKIIVSNTSCLPEIYKDAAYYIDPYSQGCDLDVLLQSEVGTPNQILEEYTWDRAAQKLMTLLNKLCD